MWDVHGGIRPPRNDQPPSSANEGRVSDVYGGKLKLLKLKVLLLKMKKLIACSRILERKSDHKDKEKIEVLEPQELVEIDLYLNLTEVKSNL
jgi:hypothetical protein